MAIPTRGRDDLFGSVTEGKAHWSGFELLDDHGDLITMLEYERAQKCSKGALDKTSPLSARSWLASRWRKMGLAVVKLIQAMLLMSLMYLQPVGAAFISFENCLSPNIINSNPLQLQFKPLFVYAAFNSTAASHNINVTVYGNVTGIATQQPYPAPNDPQWANPNDTVGKIPDVDKTNNKFSTLTATFNVLDYTPYDAPATQFCNTTVHGRCPLSPAFTANL